VPRAVVTDGVAGDSVQMTETPAIVPLGARSSELPAVIGGRRQPSSVRRMFAWVTRGRAARMPNALTVYLVLAAAMSICYFSLPEYHLMLWTPLGLSAVVATLVGLQRYRPRQRAAWWLLAAAEFCFIAGDTTYNVLTQFFGEANPFPSVADVFYLLTYPLFATAFFLFIRAQSPTRDRAALIDAVIITTGLGLLSWMYLIVPNYQVDGLTGAQRFISVAYPLGDVLVLAMLARLVGGAAPGYGPCSSWRSVPWV